MTPESPDGPAPQEPVRLPADPGHGPHPAAPFGPAPAPGFGGAPGPDAEVRENAPEKWSPGTSRRAVRTWAVTAGVLALLGLPVGWWWQSIVPTVRYVVVDGKPLFADAESQAVIGGDGRFVVITMLVGTCCGAVAYWRGGRDNDPSLLLGLAAGGLAGAVLAWQLGHRIGLAAFDRAVRAAPDGRVVTGPADLHAPGVLIFWALTAVAVYGLLEVLVNRLGPGDGGERGGGEPDQVGGGEFELQPAPSGGDKNRVEP